MDVVEWLYGVCRLDGRHYVILEAIRMAGVSGRRHVIRRFVDRAMEDDRAPTHTADAAFVPYFHSTKYCANKEFTAAPSSTQRAPYWTLWRQRGATGRSVPRPMWAKTATACPHRWRRPSARPLWASPPSSICWSACRRECCATLPWSSPLEWRFRESAVGTPPTGPSSPGLSSVWCRFDRGDGRGMRLH